MKAPTPLFSAPVRAAAADADLSGGLLAVALAAEASSLPRARLLRLATAEARALDPQALIQQEAGAVVALLALPEPLGRVDRLELAETLRRRLAAATETVISAGVSHIVSVGDTRQLGRACGLALAALSAGRRVLGPGRTTDLRGLTARAVLALLAEAPALDLFCQDLLGPVLEYDARHRGRLVPTLEAYFAARQQPSGAADRLGEHRNTITYRLGLIERLTGRSLRDPDDVLCFMIGLRAGLIAPVHTNSDRQ